MNGRAFDGPNDQWKAEPEFGAIYELKINSRQKFYTQALYYPELQDPSLYRLNVKVGWEVKVSDTRDIAIRLWLVGHYAGAPDTQDLPFRSIEIVGGLGLRGRGIRCLNGGVEFPRTVAQRDSENLHSCALQFPKRWGGQG